jgi:signal peptidase I
MRQGPRHGSDLQIQPKGFLAQGRFGAVNARAKTSNELAGEVVRCFGAVRFRVLGTSMAPAIRHRDVVSVESARIEEISAGEIVLFSHYGRMFAHRVVAPAHNPEEPQLITRGDRLPDNDPPVTPSDFLGRVVCIERGSRRFKPNVDARGPRSLTAQMLRSSELATRVYLSFFAWVRKASSTEAECRL